MSPSSSTTSTPADFLVATLTDAPVSSIETLRIVRVEDESLGKRERDGLVGAEFAKPVPVRVVRRRGTESKKDAQGGAPGPGSGPPLMV